MPRRDLGAADSVTPEATGFEHPAGGQLVVGILEDASERALVRRLRRLSLRLHLPHRGLDLVLRPRLEAELSARDDLAGLQARAPVLEPELERRSPIRPVGGDDERTLEDAGDVASICAGIHLHTAADRPRDRAGELEPTQRRGAHAVEADGERCAASGQQAVALDRRRREVSRTA